MKAALKRTGAAGIVVQHSQRRRHAGGDPEERRGALGVHAQELRLALSYDEHRLPRKARQRACPLLAARADQPKAALAVVDTANAAGAGRMRVERLRLRRKLSRGEALRRNNVAHSRALGARRGCPLLGENNEELLRMPCKPRQRNGRAHTMINNATESAPHRVLQAEAAKANGKQRVQTKAQLRAFLLADPPLCEAAAVILLPRDA